MSNLQVLGRCHCKAQESPSPWPKQTIPAVGRLSCPLQFSIFHSPPQRVRKTRPSRPRRVNRYPIIMATRPDSALPFSKRRRVTRACDNCKSRKRRCNGEKPCAYCTEHRALCTYNAPYTRGRPDQQSTAPSVSEGAQQTSPRRVSRWRPNSVTLSTHLSEDASSMPRTSSRWPQVSLDQAQTATMDDDERGGVQSSRARSPVGGEGVAPMGQYLGPASPFSVSRQSDADQTCCGLIACASQHILSSSDPYEVWWYETMDHICTMQTCYLYEARDT
jgi:hypothetical protein